jgi:hypothetical protein
MPLIFGACAPMLGLVQGLPRNPGLSLFSTTIRIVCFEGPPGDILWCSIGGGASDGDDL